MGRGLTDWRRPLPRGTWLVGVSISECFHRGRNALLTSIGPVRPWASHRELDSVSTLQGHREDNTYSPQSSPASSPSDSHHPPRNHKQEPAPPLPPETKTDTPPSRHSPQAHDATSASRTPSSPSKSAISSTSSSAPSTSPLPRGPTSSSPPIPLAAFAPGGRWRWARCP